MTTNQLIALGFPLLTAAAVGLTGLFIRRPWSEPALINLSGVEEAERIIAEREEAERISRQGGPWPPATLREHLAQEARARAGAESVNLHADDLRLTPERPLTDAEITQMESFKRTGKWFPELDLDVPDKEIGSSHVGHYVFARKLDLDVATDVEVSIQEVMRQKPSVSREAIGLVKEILTQVERNLSRKPISTKPMPKS
jgi:hypothetical protein